MNDGRFHTRSHVEQWIYSSYMAAKDHLSETLDEKVRNPERTRDILDRLDSPDHHGYNVMVTGSKGKGSTAVMMAEMVRGHGYRVGLFTSPHLVQFTERIRVDGEVIPDDAFVRIGKHVQAAAHPVIAKLARDEYVGPVGLAAAIAAVYFQEQETDVNIWECGRGALYDDVNQLRHDGAVITPIMEEHLTHLGPELRDIVKHKFSVVTTSTDWLIVGAQQAQVAREMNRLMKNQQSCKTAWLGRDIRVTDTRSGPDGTQFSVHTANGRYEKLALPLPGAFQADNAALALAATEEIASRVNQPQQPLSPTYHLNESNVRTALRNIHWPGRLEFVLRDPVIIVDGAIHRRSAQHVAHVLSPYTKTKGVLIIGIPRDKDYVGVLEVLAPLARKVIVTSANRDYLRFPRDAVCVAKSFCSQVEFKESADDAFQTGLNELRDGEWMAIVGTQSLVGEAQKLLPKLLEE